jgi:hypothetical protein
MTPEVGQVWEMNGTESGRIRGRVIQVGAMYVRLEYERTGRVGFTSLSTMVRGLRGSKCVALADGSKPPPAPPRERNRARAAKAGR